MSHKYFVHDSREHTAMHGHWDFNRQTELSWTSQYKAHASVASACIHMYAICMHICPNHWDDAP